MRKTALQFTFAGALTIILSTTLLAASEPQPFNHPLVFEPNRGQVGAQAQWIARGSGYQVFISGDSATFALFENAGEASRTHLRSAARGIPESPDIRMSVLRMKLVGSRPWKPSGLEPTGGISNYVVGNDPKLWRTNIPHYGRLRIPEVYPGIDLVFYDNKGDLEYDFVVAPGADPKQIRLAFDGADRMRMDDDAGDLVLTTSTGAQLRTHQPRVFQEIDNREVEVAGAYEILDRGQAVFTLASYDAKRTLLIDPTITFTTFIHGRGEDVAAGVAVDSAGNSYVGGWTMSTDIPTWNPTFNPPAKVCNPQTFWPQPTCIPYVFVAKLSPTGSMLFLTYMGGSDLDMASDVKADASGVYVAGITFSNDFPVYFSSYKRGSGDVFVTKLSPQGALIYSSVWGGTNVDGASAIALDSTGSVYVAGKTKSADYPISGVSFPAPTPPMQRSFGGVQDAFVTKLNPNGLLYDGYSTFLGGSKDDEAEAIAIDASGFAYVTGITFSKNFPTVGPSVGFPSGPNDSTAFVTKLVSTGTGALYSLYLGGGADEGTGIAVGATGNAYVTGDTASPAFPTTLGAFQINKPSPVTINGLFNFDGFIAEISPGGLLRSSTYLGGSNGATFPRTIALNSSGEVYVGGSTASTDFPGPSPITPNPTAGFLVKFAPSLSALGFRIYLGSQINSIAIARPTLSRRFPTVVFNSTSIYTAGLRFVPGSDVRNLNNVDGIVVKVDDSPVIFVAQ